MVYLAKKNGIVVHHTSKEAMGQLDGVEPEKTVTDAEFEAAGGIARIINNKIVLGKTSEEIAEAAKQNQIAGYKARLKQIDQDAGAGRSVRKTAMDMGQMLTAVRQVALDFADVANILHQQNPDLAEFNPTVNTALQMIVQFDPTTNEDLQRITTLETEASGLREQLAAL